MRYLLIVVLTLSLYAQESCYSVQIASAYKGAVDDVSKKEYDNSCKVMEIGKNIVVRCGCFEKYIDAKKTLPKFKAKYKNAYIVSTQNDFYIKNLQAIPAIVKKKNVITTPPEKIVGLDSNDVIDAKVAVVGKKKKYVKKRESHYKYERYLNTLKSRRGLFPYDFRYKFGAQFSYDFGYVNEAADDYFKSDWRRIRVYHEGSFFDEKLFYELEYSFTGENKYKDNFIGYQDKFSSIDTKYRVKVGNIKIPFSLERYTSSKNITFMERSLNDAYGDSRKLGAELLLNKKIGKNHLNLFVSIFSNSLDQKESDDVNQPGYSFRTTYAYKFRKQHLFTLGVAYWSQNMYGTDLKFNEGAESKFLNKKYVSVSVKKIETLTKQNMELLYIYDKYSLQGEYSIASLNAINKSKTGEYTHYTFPAYYLQGSYFIIGKGRKYKFGTSTLGKVKPKRGGALEVALRYSHIDLNDKDEDNNGAQTDYNFGLNWYFNRELKFMLNYIVAEPKETKLYDGRLNVLQGRVLFAF